MVTVVFSIDLRPDLDADEYEALGARMAELVSAQPGFLGMEFGSRDGGEILIARFASHEALAAWREHPQHQEAQQRGREEFFSGYRIEVCDHVRAYEFERPGGGPPP